MTDRPILVILLCAAAVAGFAPKPAEMRQGRAPAGCAAHNAAGYVARLDARAAKDGQAGAPTIVRSNAAYGLSEGDSLCVNDVVTNPSASRWDVRLLLAGGHWVMLEPGQHKVVPRPTLWTMTVDLKARFDQFFQKSATDVGSVTRGASVPAPNLTGAREVLAVVEWGPLTVAWPGGGPNQSRTAVLTAGGKTVSLPAQGDLLRIDLRRQCAMGCVIAPAEKPAPADTLKVRIVPADRAPMPTWMPDVPREPAARALLGAWLLDERKAEWSLQGESLLWSSACAHPVVLDALHSRYFGIDDTKLCRAAAFSGGR